MQELYYTPDVTDFRVGFECEVRDPDYQGQSDGTEWKPMSADRESVAETLKCWKHFQEYRVPYLYDEQINNEGYKTHGDDEGNYVFGDYPSSDPRFTFSYYPSDKRLLVSKEEKGKPNYAALFDGTCRCINDFRMIRKILGIK